MAKFSKGDVVIITKSDSPFKRGQIVIINENDSVAPYVTSNCKYNNYPISEYDAELLSSIPLDNICVHTKTKEQWDDVCKSINKDWHYWQDDNYGIFLKGRYTANVENYINDNYVISYEDWVKYLKKPVISDEIKVGDYMVCIEESSTLFGELNTIYPVIKISKRWYYFESQCSIDSKYVKIRKATPEEAELCKLNDNKPTHIDWKPKVENPNLKVCIKSDGTKEYGRKIIDYLVSLGGKDPNHWEGNNLDNPYYFIKENGRIANDNQIPKGYTEISLKKPELSPRDKAIKWLEDNGYVKSDKYLPCRECDLHHSNNGGHGGCYNFLNILSADVPCFNNKGGCGWIKKEEPTWVSDIQKQVEEYHRQAFINSILTGQPLIFNFKSDKEEEITIFEKPKNKRKLIQVSI